MIYSPDFYRPALVWMQRMGGTVTTAEWRNRGYWSENARWLIEAGYARAWYDAATDERGLCLTRKGRDLLKKRVVAAPAVQP